MNGFCQQLRGLRYVFQRVDQCDNLKLTRNCRGWSEVKSFEARNSFYHLFVMVIQIESCQRPAGCYPGKGPESGAVAAADVQQSALLSERESLLQSVKKS